MKLRLKPGSFLVITMFSFATIGAVMAFTSHSAPRANDNETPDDVIRVANAARPELESLLSALKDAQLIVTRLGNRAYATQVLEAAKKNDKKGLADLLKNVAPNRQITVKEITDFTITFSFGTEGHDYTLCIGDKCKHPSGAKSPIVFSEF